MNPEIPLDNSVSMCGYDNKELLSEEDLNNGFISVSINSIGDLFCVNVHE